MYTQQDLQKQCYARSRDKDTERSEPYGSGAPEQWRSSVANVGVFTHSHTIHTETDSLTMEKIIQPLCDPTSPLDTQEELPGMDGPMGHMNVLFGLQSKNTWLEFSEANSMLAPRVPPDAIGVPSVKPSGATWGRCSPGSG